MMARNLIEQVEATHHPMYNQSNLVENLFGVNPLAKAS